MSDGKVFKATREIAAKLDSEEIKYSILTGNDSSTVQVKYSGDNFSTLEILFISRDDDNDVAVRAWGFVSGIAKEKRDKMIGVVNAMNDRFRYVKFVLDDDDDLNLTYDIPMTVTNVGEVAREIISRFVNIADEAYPEFMKALWA